jgi:hypothetical protein
MSSRIPLPEPNGYAAAYKLLLKKENVVKPASVLIRKEMLEKNKRANYINEYDRILGLLEGHADRFNIPGGHFQKDKLTNRLQMLKKLFQESHEPFGGKHPIMKK